MGLRSSLFDSSDEFDLDTSTSAEPRQSFSGSDVPAGLTQGLYGARANFYSMFSDPESRAKARVDRARAADVPVQFRSSEDVDWSSPSDIIDYAQQQAGALAGSSAPTLALAGGTYGLGAALGLPATALGRAASAAAFGGETLQGYGEMAGELRDAGQEPGAGTVLGSIGYGLLGMTELKGLYKGILESSSAELLHATARAEGTKQSLLRSTLDATGTIAKGVGKGVVRQVPEQTGQELAQEGILIGNRMAYDPNYDTSEIPGRLKETATATALGTGLAGGLAGGVGGVRTQMARGKPEATPPEPVGLPRASQAELRQMRDQEAADAKAEFEADYRQGVAEYLGYELPPLLQPIFDQALPLPTGPAQTDEAHTATAPDRPALPTEFPAAPKPPEAPTSVQTTDLAQQPSIPGTSTMTTPPSDFTPPGATHEEANQASTNETTEQGQKPSPLLTEPTPPPRTSWQPHSQRESNAAITYRVLQENGVPPHVAAGIVGSLSGESGRGLNPLAFNAKGQAHGIAQWRKERWSMLRRFAAEEGGDASSLQTQLQYLLSELSGPEKAAFNRVLRARDEREAAELFTRHFERPSEAEIADSLTTRQDNATRMLQGGLTAPSGTYSGNKPRVYGGPRDPDDFDDAPRIRSSLGPAVTSGQTRSLDLNVVDNDTTDVTTERPVFEDMSNASVIGQSYDSDGHELTKDAAVRENPNVFRTIISGDEGDTKYSGSRVSKAFSAIFPGSVTAQKTDGPTLYHVNLDLDRASARTDRDIARLQQALNTSMTDEGVDITDRMAQSGRLVRRAKAILEAIAGADKSDPKSKLMFLHDAVRGDKDKSKHVEVGMTRAGLTQLGRAVSDEQYDNTPQGDYDAAVDGAAYWLTQGFRPAKAVKQDGKTTWVVANRKEAQTQMKELLGERPAMKESFDTWDPGTDLEREDARARQARGAGEREIRIQRDELTTYDDEGNPVNGPVLSAPSRGFTGGDFWEDPNWTPDKPRVYHRGSPLLTLEDYPQFVGPRRSGEAKATSPWEKPSTKDHKRDPTSLVAGFHDELDPRREETPPSEPFDPRRPDPRRDSAIAEGLYEAGPFKTKAAANEARIAAIEEAVETSLERLSAQFLAKQAKDLADARYELEQTGHLRARPAWGGTSEVALDWHRAGDKQIATARKDAPSAGAAARNDAPLSETEIADALAKLQAQQAKDYTKWHNATRARLLQTLKSTTPEPTNAKNKRQWVFERPAPHPVQSNATTLSKEDVAQARADMMRDEERSVAKENLNESQTELSIDKDTGDQVTERGMAQSNALEEQKRRDNIRAFTNDERKLIRRLRRLDVSGGLEELRRNDKEMRAAKTAEINADPQLSPTAKAQRIQAAMDELDNTYHRYVSALLKDRPVEEADLVEYFDRLRRAVSRRRLNEEELITTPARDVTAPLDVRPGEGGVVIPSDVPAKGSVLATNVPRSLAMIVNDVLHHIGLNIQTRMISRGSIQAHIDALTETRDELHRQVVTASEALAEARQQKLKIEGRAQALQRAQRGLWELDHEIGKLREAQDNPTWLFRAIYNDHYTLAENRVPIILVGDIGDRPVNLLPAALAHEVGHVVQRAWFDQLKPEDQAGIVKELMGEGQVDPDMLAEAFANRFAEWYATRRKLQTTSNAARKAGKWGRLEQAFHDFHDMLKRVWETIRTMGARFADVQKTMLDGLDPKDPADRAVLLRAEAAEFAAKYPTFNEFLSTMVGFGGNMPDARLWKNPRWRQLVFDPILAMPAQQRVKWPSSNAELVAAAGDTEAGAFAEYEAEEGAQPEATQPSTPSAPSPRAEVPADVADIVKRGKELLPGILARTAPASHHDMSIDEFDQRVRQAASAAAARAQRYASGTRVAQSAVVADYKKRFKGTWDAMARIGRTVFQADGTRLRNLADGRFAGVGNIIAPPMGKRMDQIQLRAIPLRRENGVVIGTTRIFAPLHDLIGMERRRLREKYHVFPLLNEIIELHQQDQAAYDDLLENLWDEQAPTRSALAQKIRTFYKDILKELVAAGISFDATPGPNANDPTHGPTKLKIAEREGYFTKMPDIDKMLAEPDEVIEAFTKAYQARLDKGQELPENEHGIPYATAREAAEAQHYRTVTGNYDDVFTDLQQQKETGLRGPAFPQARSRPFSNEEYQQFGLTRWLERDIAKVISTYLDTSARRAATQRAFGFPLQIRNNDRASAALKERFRLARLDPSLMHTPTAAIELLIHEAERDGLLNRDGVKEVYTLIRSALGQLNVGRSPRGRRWMNRLVALETLNTMSGSALMQLSDFGINLWRGENLPRDLGNLAKLFDGTTREQQRRILEMLGMAADHMAQHAYLTDIGTTNDPLAEGSRKVTEFMFKYNGMQKLSEYSMMLASIIGQDYMRDYARQATNATLPQAQRDKALGRLKELHPDLTPDDVLNGDLENDIRPDRRIRLRYALRRYINTSHIHDQHGYTSQIFNDWRFKPLTMLKGFMMKFHNIVLKLMWERMKEQPDLRHAVMPFVTLAICTMPLAAMGLYAKDLLRRKAPEYVGRMFGQRWTTKRKHKDRTPEQWIHDSFMATGMGGMYLGVMDSMYEAPQHGMPALVALGGPPITHGYTMMTRTADEWVPASIPGLNIFPAAKSGLRSELRDTFGWGVRDDEE